ncbi:MAG: hypothetical protein EPO51_13840 [Phenylobacterium sp.]|uniref:hypothetical protein n=1 Tax=Phenylobacterium sp. TaxID=1871053 RepID=UPI0012095CF9|nr:hypothetical protein [Phenylobacterium sp.]TAJ71375.1 MAG: hypothetical protein EPO51_13840 [Phenylobacterium sp.]
MLRATLVLALAALGLSSCSGAAPKGAAESASRLLTAAYKNDRVAFEAEIDRAAVRDDVRRQVNEMARSKALEVDGGPSEFALDRMISPDALRLVDAKGAPLTAAPTPQQVAPLMKVVDGKKVCLRDAESPENCLLTFAKGTGAEAKGHWRLVGMRALDLRVEIASVGG